jgi:hypothetical protein
VIHLRAELFAGLDDPNRLRAVLQTALELEHATIPPYLFAAYSLGTSNVPIRNLLRDIVREEMLHMALVCNLINAIGGSPRLDHAEFVPTYPTHLPGAVQDDLLVPLEPFNPTLVEKIFLRIEEPETPLDFPVLEAAVAAPQTIGQFYAAIARAIEQKGNGLFTGDPARQVLVAIDDDESFAVNDVESALRAIGLIVSQGEGTAVSPLEGPNGEPAHYYRFMEILKGRVLVADTTVPEGFSYSGDRIEFNATDVFPAKPNIKVADLPVDSPARQVAEQFNRDYTTMLRALHAAFNGDPDRLNDALNLMLALRSTAIQLMRTEIAPGVNAGPTFEFATS